MNGHIRRELKGKYGNRNVRTKTNALERTFTPRRNSLPKHSRAKTHTLNILYYAITKK